MIGVVLPLVLLTLWYGALSLGLYRERSEDEAVVEGEYRRLGLFPRVSYSYSTPAGIVRGTAPAHCAHKGIVRIACRPLQPHWHRPRGMMFEDVMLAASFWLAAPIILLIRVVAALREAQRQG